jgi:hypothetical protein
MPYKPSCSQNPQLRTIVLDVCLPENFEMPLFDFSGVPAATIDATFPLGIEYKFHIPVRIAFAGLPIPLILTSFFPGRMEGIKNQFASCLRGRS